MFTHVAVVGAFTISRLRLLFFDIVRSRDLKKREFKVQIPRKKKEKIRVFLSLSLGSVSIDSSYAMTRKAGGYLRELVSVRGRPESASEHAALLWVLLSLREFLPIIKSWNAHTNVLRVKHGRKRRRRRRRMTRPPVDLCVDDETISSDARALSLARFGNASSFGRERERCVKCIELEALFPL